MSVLVFDYNKKTKKALIPKMSEHTNKAKVCKVSGIVPIGILIFEQTTIMAKHNPISTRSLILLFFILLLLMMPSK